VRVATKRGVRVKLTVTALGGLGLGSPVTFDTLHSLAVRLWRAGNRIECDGTPPGGASVLRTGGHDSVAVKLRPDVPCHLLVDAPEPSQDQLEVVVENAQPGQISRTSPAGTTPGSVRVTRPGGLVQVVSYSRVAVVMIN
jgi:hypothetical protein